MEKTETVKITTYWSGSAAERILEESKRSGLAASSLIRFHTLRSLKVSDLFLGGSNEKL